MGRRCSTPSRSSVTARALRHAGASLPCRSNAVSRRLHGYAVAFWWAAGFFGVGAILTFVMLESGVPEHDDARVA